MAPSRKPSTAPLLLPSRREAIRTGLMAAAAFLGLECPDSTFGQRIPKPLQDPTKLLINTMGTSLLGKNVGPLLSGQLIDLLGIGTRSLDFEAYFNAIEDKLDNIDIKLDQIGAQLESLHVDFESLTSDVLSVGTAVTSLGVESVLNKFADNANKVDGSFQLYLASLKGLGSEADSDRQNAAHQLFEIFDTINTKNISVALKNVQDQFSPRLTEVTGLLEYQLQMLEAKLREYASGQNNFKLLPARAVDYSGWNYHDVSNNDGLWGYGKLVTGSQQKAMAFLNEKVAEAMTAFVKVQLQGMLMLSSAWGGTINADQLTAHTERNRSIFAQFDQFPKNAAKRVDDAVGNNLKEFGKHLGPPMTHDAESMWTMASALGGVDSHFEGHGSQLTGGINQGYQLTDEYIMWGRFQVKMPKYALLAPPHTVMPEADTEMLLLVERPWEYENCRAVAINYAATNKERLLPGYKHLYLGQMNVPRLQEAALTNLNFLHSLV